MKPPRLSIAKLMVVVVIVAINFGAARILFSYNTEMLIGVALSGIVLQLGLYQLLRSRGRGRAFWAGFITCGLMATMSFVWAILFPEVIGIDFDNNGSMATVRTPGSPLYTAWFGYAEFVSDHIIGPILESHSMNSRINFDSYLGGALLVSIRVVVRFVPQLLIALVGGLLTSLIVRRWGKKPADAPNLPAARLLPVARS